MAKLTMDESTGDAIVFSEGWNANENKMTDSLLSLALRQNTGAITFLVFKYIVPVPPPILDKNILLKSLCCQNLSPRLLANHSRAARCLTF